MVLKEMKDIHRMAEQYRGRCIESHWISVVTSSLRSLANRSNVIHKDQATRLLVTQDSGTGNASNLRHADVSSKKGNQETAYINYRDSYKRVLLQPQCLSPGMKTF